MTKTEISEKDLDSRVIEHLTLNSFNALWHVYQTIKVISISRIFAIRHAQTHT